MFILVTGPTRSGKSEWAEEITLRLFQQMLSQKMPSQKYGADDILVAAQQINQQINQITDDLLVNQSVNHDLDDALNGGLIEDNRRLMELIYIATASHNPDDAEWTARIQEHQRRRCDPWQTMEVPKHLAQTLQGLNVNQVVLVDALGTWLANFLDCDDQQWQMLETELVRAVVNCRATVVCVAEEVGWSVVPAYALGRLFRDRLGRLVRRLAGVADQTYLVVAGFALDLRQMGTRVTDSL